MVILETLDLSHNFSNILYNSSWQISASYNLHFVIFNNQHNYEKQ
jgi:hypothetical protein